MKSVRLQESMFLNTLCTWVALDGEEPCFSPCLSMYMCCGSSSSSSISIHLCLSAVVIRNRLGGIPQ